MNWLLFASAIVGLCAWTYLAFELGHQAGHHHQREHDWLWLDRVTDEMILIDPDAFATFVEAVKVVTPVMETAGTPEVAQVEMQELEKLWRLK